MNAISVTRMSAHVIQLAVPTPTLPPAFETNTYLVVDGTEALLVDAGTTDAQLLTEIQSFVRSLNVNRVQLVATHYHRDHTQGLPWLQTRYQTPIYIQPLDIAPALAVMGPEAKVKPVPASFQVGRVTVFVDERMGHTHGHLHLRIYPDEVVLVGDHLAGTGSVWVGPPDGHLGAYYEALDSLIAGDCRMGGPGHGPVIEHVQSAAAQQKQHRQDREQQILTALQNWTPIREIVDAVYRGQVPDAALAFARKTIQANLQYFLEHNTIAQRFDPTQGCTVYRQKTPGYLDFFN